MQRTVKETIGSGGPPFCFLYVRNEEPNRVGAIHLGKMRKIMFIILRLLVKLGYSWHVRKDSCSNGSNGDHVDGDNNDVDDGN